MAKNIRKNKSKKSGNSKQSMAELADKYFLYEQAVQCVESEIDFVDETFQKLRDRNAQTLREDFCGTINTSCEWITRRDTNIAYSVDIDAEVLAWGKQHHIAKLTTDQAQRINVLNSDVLNVDIEPVDTILAMNFSYWLLKGRAVMKNYFRRVYHGLKKDGIFFLDAYGGYESFQEMEETTKCDGFTYIWDQSHYNPITGDATSYIHFKFKDGSRMQNAFSYHWRLWTLPEICELLGEAGFKPTVYWEGTDEDGEGDGIFSPTTEGEADAGWIAYIVAEK